MTISVLKSSCHNQTVCLTLPPMGCITLYPGFPRVGFFCCGNRSSQQCCPFFDVYHKPVLYGGDGLERVSSGSRTSFCSFHSLGRVPSSRHAWTLPANSEGLQSIAVSSALCLECRQVPVFFLLAYFTSSTVTSEAFMISDAISSRFQVWALFREQHCGYCLQPHRKPFRLYACVCVSLTFGLIYIGWERYINACHRFKWN